MSSTPKSHQAIAERFNLDMTDPFTRMFVAAWYWQERAEFWKHRTLLRELGESE